MNLKQRKLELKEMAQAIRESRVEHKTRQRRFSQFQLDYPEWNVYRSIDKEYYKKYIDNPENQWWRSWKASPHEYRLKHIIYCLLRGRTYEQIENKVHDCNKLSKSDWVRINQAVETAKQEIDHAEALRSCAG